MADIETPISWTYIESNFNNDTHNRIKFFGRILRHFVGKMGINWECFYKSCLIVGSNILILHSQRLKYLFWSATIGLLAERHNTLYVYTHSHICLCIFIYVCNSVYISDPHSHPASPIIVIMNHAKPNMPIFLTFHPILLRIVLRGNITNTY